MDINPYRSGEQVLIQVPVASATVIDKGDQVALSAGKAVPLDSTYDTSSAAAAIADAGSNAFLGIAMDASASGDTDAIKVDISTSAIYEFDLYAAAAVSVGDMMTFYAGVSGDNMTAQTITADTTASFATCVVVEEHSSAAGTPTKVKMLEQRILSTLLT